MNGICQFRKCTLSNDELLSKVDKLTDEIFKTGKIPTRNIPARTDEDYDLLVGELILRLKDANENNFDKGYKQGYSDATNEACKEIAKNYQPNK